MAFLFGDSARMYSSNRRRQRELQFNGPIEEMAGAEVAAGAADHGAARAIGIGVATGVLTLLLNRWIERLLK